MAILEDVEYLEGLPDSDLRKYMYFMCGYRPQLMAAVVGTIQRLERESKEICESSHAQTCESSPDPKTTKEIESNPQS